VGVAFSTSPEEDRRLKSRRQGGPWPHIATAAGAGAAGGVLEESLGKAEAYPAWAVGHALGCSGLGGGLGEGRTAGWKAGGRMKS